MMFHFLFLMMDLRFSYFFNFALKTVEKRGRGIIVGLLSPSKFLLFLLLILT